MKEIIMIETLDGSKHDTRKKAKEHLENLLGEILDPHVRELCNMSKFTQFQAYLHDPRNLRKFATALKIWEDSENYTAL